MYVFELQSIGNYSFPTKIYDVTDVLGKGVYLAETEKDALREMYLRILEWPIYRMPSVAIRKNELIEEIRNIYMEEFPEVFI